MDLVVSGVGHAYGALPVLEGIDLHVASGEIVAVLGPSGCGKSTLLGIAGGLIEPGAGAVRLRGEAPPRCLNALTYVFQDFALLPWRDVAANVALPLEHHGLGRAEIARRVDAALERIGLAEFRGAWPRQLSGGMRQRVGIARALVVEPAVLLMDEPLSALDKQLREAMQLELRQLHDALGMTTIYVTHDQREALTMSDRIAVIAGGRLMQLDSPRALYERPANRFVAEFVGESSFLPVQLDGGSWRWNGQTLNLAEQAAGVTGTRTWLMLRPERLRLAGADERDANRIEARVTDTIYQGDSYVVQALLADGTRVSARGIANAGALAAMPERGATVSLAFDARDAVLVPEP
jgi:putative spermidine/putrescine transport system ATP-binding protein